MSLLAYFALYALALDLEFDGFAHFHDWDAQGKVNIGFLTLPSGGTILKGIGRDICSQDSKCQAVGNGGGSWRVFSNDGDYDVYLAVNTSVVPSAICEMAVGLYYPSQAYVDCTNDFFTIIETFQLAPSLVYVRCLQNPSCIGFRVKNDQTAGDLFGFDSVWASGIFKLN